MALVMAVDPANPHSVARTLSARYYKDGAEISSIAAGTGRSVRSILTIR